MYLHGEFVNIEGKTCRVEILTGGDRSTDIEIGANGSGVAFTDDPVEISSEVNDTFDVLLRTSATIRLQCAEFLPDFYQKNCRDAVVNVCRDGECVFAGFIEPMAYTQGYNEIYDEVELSCIDALSALQYTYYGGYGCNGVTYSAVKKKAGRKTMKAVLSTILDDLTTDLNVDGGTCPVYYDGSIGLSAERQYSVFADVAVNDLVFLGDEGDDVMTNEDVVAECLRYLNLHIAQRGHTFYIFSWDSVKSSKAITWQPFSQNGDSVTTERETVTLSGGNVADTNCSISIGEVYNVISVTCDTESVEDVLISPLDEDSIVSPYSTYQKYMTEYASDGEGVKAYNAFYNMVHGTDTDWSEATITDWFVQVKNNVLWKFYINGTRDVIQNYCKGGKDQNLLPDALGLMRGAALIDFGKVQRNMAKDDNSPTTKVDRTTYMVMTVHGNGATKEDDLIPTDFQLQSCIPYAEYTGKSGGVFSPADEETTNYLVFSGSIILNPRMPETDAYGDVTNGIAGLRALEWTRSLGLYEKGANLYVWHDTKYSRNNKDGRYYAREYWQAENPKDEVTTHEGALGLYPYTSEGKEDYEFKYSSIGDKTDTISKVGLIACMLVIGDKVCVEKPLGEDLGTGVPGTGNGQLSDFVWQKYKTLEECADEDEYYQQSFTLGIDPKIGDKLLGTEFDIQTNFDYTLNLEADSGTAIPITKADKVSGDVSFKILGPVNAIWDEITRRHPTFFRHTKWGSKSVALLAQSDSLMVKSFEVKCYSNGSGESDDDGDIVYTSDTDETFVNENEITFKICSALTSAECKDLGVKNEVRLSTAVDATTGDGILSVHDFVGNEDGKPEQMYVDRYYTECHKPRVLMEQNIRDTETGHGIFTHYKHEAMNKEFYVYGMGYNLMDGSASLKLKEIGND